MSDYELIELIFEFEKTGVEYGQYIMAGMFAYIVAHYCPVKTSRTNSNLMIFI